MNLTLKDFGIQKMKVNNIINLKKDDCIKYINNQGSLPIDIKNPIFNKKNNNDLLLNIRIININKKESNLFLFDSDKEIYNLQSSDIELLNNFFNLIIQPFILHYSKYELKKVPKYIKDDFMKKLKEFFYKGKIKNKIEKHENSHISLPITKNNILNESYIPLQINSINSFNSIIPNKNISIGDNNLIPDSKNKNNSDIFKKQK